MTSQPNPSTSSRSDDDQPPDDPAFDLRITELLANRTPKSTNQVTKWALKRFQNWSGNEFKDLELDRINYTLSMFVVETGDRTMSRTMYSIIAGLNRELKKRHPDADLFSTKRFLHFRNVFDGYLKKKQLEECVAVRQADCLTQEDEERLWDSVFGAEKLQRTGHYSVDSLNRYKRPK